MKKMNQQGETKMIEYGLIFLLCVALTFVWVWRDNSRWSKAINYSKSNRLQITAAQENVNSLNVRLAKAEETIDRLRTTLMSYQVNFEQDFNEINQRCEMIEASQKRISKNQTYIRGLAAAPRALEVKIIENGVSAGAN